MKNTILFLFLASVFFACQKNTGGSTARETKLSVYLTDHATPAFDKVFIDIRKLEVKLEDDSLSNGGWVELSINPGVYDILRFRNGLDTLFANGTLPGDRLRKLRLTLGTDNSVEEDGQLIPLRIRNSDMEITANLSDENFEVTAGGDVLFWIDFDAGRSIKVNNSGSGNNNGYELRPHIRVFTHRRTGRIEGTVLPQEADPIIKAINGTDTATAIPDHNGKFRIVGLNAGVYQVLYDGANGYLDSTITNVRVINGEDRRLPTVTLHQ